MAGRFEVSGPCLSAGRGQQVGSPAAGRVEEGWVEAGNIVVGKVLVGMLVVER